MKCSAMDFETTAEQIAHMLTELPPETETEPTQEEAHQTTPAPTDNPGVIFTHQKEVFKSLLTTAKAFAKENWFSLPVLPRWHTLIVGSTGTGKSHLVHALGKFLGWPVLTVWSTRWIVAGGRGKETWTEIGKWLDAQNGKCVLFLDETDKLLNDGSLWGTHMRAEIFQLLDRDLPAEIEISDPEGENSCLATWAKAQKVLRCDTLIIAAGAFQNLWDYRPQPLGFSSEKNPSTENNPSSQELKSVLPPELINRFGQILQLAPLTRDDYAAMARKTAAALPAELQGKFTRIADKNLAEAVRDGLGARYVEDCITAALLLEDQKEKTPQKPAVSRRRAISP